MLVSIAVDEALRSLIEQQPGTLRNFQKGEFLFRQGDEKKFFFLVVEGLIKIVSSSERGRELITEFLFPADICGSLCAGDCLPYQTSGECIRDSKVMVMPLATFNQLKTEFPELAQRSMESCRTKMRFMRDMMVGIAVERAEQRAARALRMLMDRLGHQTSDGVEFTMPLNRQEFAELIGVTVETGIRLLSKFRKKGVIEEKDHQITVNDPETLHRLADLGIYSE